MDVFVDDKRVDETFVGDGAIEDALRHVQSNLCAPDHLVVGIRCDGQDITGDTMVTTLRKCASSFGRLDVFTGARETLVTEAMDQASACLTDTADACQRVAELFTEGKTVEAAEQLGECLNVWQQIHEAVAKSLEMLQLDPEKITINDEPMIELIRRPKETLLQVRDALRIQDYVMLADILQYEFREVTELWHAIIAKLREEGKKGDKNRWVHRTHPTP
ncbi:MAG: hypothetical protein WBE26_05695 [Phycisphaerae bacterium]